MSSKKIESIIKEIQRIGRNFDKDSLSRKTANYAKERLIKLQQLRLSLQDEISRAEEEGSDYREKQEEDEFTDAVDSNKYEEEQHDDAADIVTQEVGDQHDAEDNADPEVDPDTASPHNQSSKFPKMSTISLSEGLRLTPDFDGSASELHRFINACETTLSLLSEADQLAFVKILKLKLKDKAYEVVKYTTYTTFKE